MLSVGVTGGIGSGKSLICSILENMGYPVFYSDLEAKNIMHHNPSAKTALIELFGEELYKNDELDRRWMAEKIFQDDSLRLQVNAIVHPLVRQAFQDFSNDNRNVPVFNEAAILFETGAYKNFDRNILVCAPVDIRVGRVMHRDMTSESEVRSRMAKQWTDDQKRPLADFIVENDGQTPLLNQLETIVDKLTT